MINYLKVYNPPAQEIIVFDDDDPSAVETALARALASQRRMGGDVSVFRMPRVRQLPGISVIGMSRR